MKLYEVFITYILFPLLSVLFIGAAVVLNKKNSRTSNKYLIVFMLIGSLAIAIPGLLTLTGINFMPIYYIAIQLAFLLVGVYYSKKLETMFSGPDKSFSQGMSLLCTFVILGLGSFLFSLVFNHVGDLQYGFMASTSTFTLAIPMFFRWSYDSLLGIPAEIHQVWKYDPHYQEPDFTSDTIEKIIVLEIELSKKPEDLEYIKVKAKAPHNFNFGEWFQMFILNYNVKYAENPIEHCAENGEMYQWIFYIKPSFYQSRKYIDYKKTVEGNGLAERNYTIVCKRVENIVA